MSDRPAWGTPPSRDPSPSADDRLAELYSSVVSTGRRKSSSAGGAPSGRGRAAVVLVAVLAVCAVVGGLFLRSGSTGSPASGTIVMGPSSGTGVTSLVGQSDVWSAGSTPRLIDDLVEVAGGTQFVGIYMYPDSVSAVAPTAPGATTTDRYSWRDGHAKRDGPEGVLEADKLFDATTVDWTKVEGLVAQAPELSGITDTSPAVYVDRAVTGGASAAARIWLRTSDDYDRGASIIADEKGQIVWMDSDVEGSPAFEHRAAGLHQVDRTQRAVADLVAVAGSTQFITIDVYTGRLAAQAVAAPGSTKVDDLYWEQGFAWVDSTARDVDPAVLFDITTVDWTLLPGLVAQARDLTGVDNPEPRVSVHGPMRRGNFAEPVFEVYLDDGAYATSGDVFFDMSGQVVSMSGGVPGSASQQWEASH